MKLDDDAFANETLISTYRPIVRGYCATASIYYAAIALTHIGLLNLPIHQVLTAASLASSVLSGILWLTLRGAPGRLSLELATTCVNMILTANICARIVLDYQTVQLGYLPAFAMGAAIICVTSRVLYLNTLVVVGASLLVVRPTDMTDFAYVLGGGVAMSIVLYGLMRNAMTSQVVARVRAERLGLQLAEAGEDNRRLAEQAMAASEAKTDFLSNMSHELRTPLTSILGYSELLGQRREIDGDSKLYVDRIYLAGKILLGTVNDILDFSRIGAGEMEFDPIACDPRAIVDDVIRVAELQAAAKGLELRLELSEPHPPCLMLDEIRFRQILLNLVSNAVKFTDAGMVVVSLAYDAEAGRLLASVRDTGIGIPEARLNRLFRRFSQVDASTTRTFGGTGLGLAICKGLVEGMGGEIGVESVSGQGSRFWFNIPVVVGEALIDVRTGDESLANALRYARILLVDDNAMVVDLVRHVLITHGAEVAIAKDGESAIAVCARQRFDLILTDLHMPRMTGADLARAIREGASANADVPIVGLTADLSARAAQSFNAVLTKPIDPRALVTTIRDQLQYDPDPCREAHNG